MSRTSGNLRKPTTPVKTVGDQPLNSNKRNVFPVIRGEPASFIGPLLRSHGWVGGSPISHSWAKVCASLTSLNSEADQLPQVR